MTRHSRETRDKPNKRRVLMMSKDDFIRAHEREVAEYLDRHPNAKWADAYDRTADRARNRMRDDLADQADALRQRRKDEGQ